MLLGFPEKQLVWMPSVGAHKISLLISVHNKIKDASQYQLKPKLLIVKLIEIKSL